MFFFFLFVISVVKDIKFSYDNSTNEATRQQYQDTIRSILKKSDSLELAHSIIYIDSMNSMSQHIVRSDTLHSKEMIEFHRQLNKWGLEIRDSSIVRKQPGSPLIVTTDLRVDSTYNNYYKVTVLLCNSGTAEAFDVRFDMYRLQKHKGSQVKIIAAQDFHDIGVGKCFEKVILYERPQFIQEATFFIEGIYEDKSGKKRYYSFSYSYNPFVKEWTMNLKNNN